MKPSKSGMSVEERAFLLRLFGNGHLDRQWQLFHSSCGRIFFLRFAMCKKYIHTFYIYIKVSGRTLVFVGKTKLLSSMVAKKGTP